MPVYDYVLVTEPLSGEQRDSLGWARRQGLTDMGNQFHYYRLTSDERVLFGGYDAVYNFRNGMGPHLDERPASFELLAAHFFETFPQLAGLRFTHRWGGAIDTCSRFSVMFGKALGGRAVFAVGYTGLGVGRQPLRRPGGARPGRGPRHRAHAPRHGARQADPVPARAAALGRHHADPARPGPGRPSRWPPRPLAARARPAGMGFDS